MGSTDKPPPTAPTWLVPLSNACLGIGVVLWLATYLLMTRRSLATHATPIPLLALGINLGWELVWALYVSDSTLEILGFTAWLVFDVPVVYATLRTARRTFSSQPLVGNNAALLLATATAASAACNALFAAWWLEEPHRGHGLKWGKSWNGLEARDTTEVTWWTAGVAQMTMSLGALGMLLQRGHSGGQSYAIWLCRFIGSQMGLTVTNVLIWWYWPEPHGYIFHPVSIMIIGITTCCDLAYPFVLAHVKRTERVLSDGSLVAGYEHGAKEVKKRR